MSIFAGVAPGIQKLTLRASRVWHGLRRGRAPEIDWVVGPFEIAGVVHPITEAPRAAASCALQPRSFYSFPFSWVAPPSRYILHDWVKGPWKLGELMSRSRGFVYVGEA